MTEYYQKLKSYMTQLFQKYFHKVKFYPSKNNFTQALLVMLVTNITSVITMVNIRNLQALLHEFRSLQKDGLDQTLSPLFLGGGLLVCRLMTEMTVPT